MSKLCEFTCGNQCLIFILFSSKYLILPTSIVPGSICEQAGGISDCSRFVHIYVKNRRERGLRVRTVTAFRSYCRCTRTSEYYEERCERRTSLGFVIAVAGWWDEGYDRRCKFMSSLFWIGAFGFLLIVDGNCCASVSLCCSSFLFAF